MIAGLCSLVDDARIHINLVLVQVVMAGLVYVVGRLDAVPCEK